MTVSFFSAGLQAMASEGMTCIRESFARHPLLAGYQTVTSGFIINFVHILVLIAIQGDFHRSNQFMHPKTSRFYMKQVLTIITHLLVIMLVYCPTTHTMGNRSNHLRALVSPTTHARSSRTRHLFSLATQNNIKTTLQYLAEKDITKITLENGMYGAIKLMPGVLDPKKMIKRGDKEIGHLYLTCNFIEQMAVHPHYRQQGHGRFLFGEAAQFCLQKGNTSMTWQADPFYAYSRDEELPSHAFLVAMYKKWGGQTTDDFHFSIDLPLQNTKQT